MNHFSPYRYTTVHYYDDRAFHPMYPQPFYVQHPPYLYRSTPMFPNDFNRRRFVHTFLREDGTIDVEKTFKTVQQITSTIQQVTPLIKQLSSFLKNLNIIL